MINLIVHEYAKKIIILMNAYMTRTRRDNVATIAE